MTGRAKLAGAVAAGLLFAWPAVAQDQPGRYAMKDIEDGMLRLDTQTGSVSYCHKKNESWVCEMAADDRSALHDEISRLHDQNEKLRKRVAELEKQPGAQDRNQLNLPSDEDMDKIMGFMERLMRRFYAFARTLRDQLGEQT